MGKKKVISLGQGNIDSLNKILIIVLVPSIILSTLPHTIAVALYVRPKTDLSTIYREMTLARQL
jgi:hypothetical protein